MKVFGLGADVGIGNSVVYQLERELKQSVHEQLSGKLLDGLIVFFPDNTNQQDELEYELDRLLTAREV